MNRLVNDKERIGAWVAARCRQTASWGSFYALGAERDGELVAGIVMNNYNGANAFAHIAIDRTGKDVFALCSAFCDYAFRFCGLRRLTATAGSNNPRLIAFDKKLGFEDEFVMIDAAPGGNLHVMVMRAETCKWLKDEG